MYTFNKREENGFTLAERFSFFFMCLARLGGGGGWDNWDSLFYKKEKLLNCEDELTKAGFLFSPDVHRAPSGIHVYVILSFCLSSVSVNVSVTQYPK